VAVERCSNLCDVFYTGYSGGFYLMGLNKIPYSASPRPWPQNFPVHLHLYKAIRRSGGLCCLSSPPVLFSVSMGMKPDYYCWHCNRTLTLQSRCLHLCASVGVGKSKTGHDFRQISWRYLFKLLLRGNYQRNSKRAKKQWM